MSYFGNHLKLREIVTKQNYVYGGATTCSQCWRALYHRDLLKDIRFDSGIYIGEDTIFFLIVKMVEKEPELLRTSAEGLLFVDYCTTVSPLQTTAKKGCHSAKIFADVTTLFIIS